MAFILKNTNIFPLPNNEHILHLATIEDGLHEYIVMLCVQGLHRGKCFIEEVVLTSVDWTQDVWAHSKFIADDNLANDLTRFADEKGITSMTRICELLERGKESWIVPGISGLLK